MLNMNFQITSTLETYRTQLCECVSKSIDIRPIRDEIVSEMAALQCCEDDPSRTVSNHLRELKNCEKRLNELEKSRDGTKQLENKMKFSTVTQQIDVTRSKIAELSKEINHCLRASDLVATNQKRLKIEVERLDTIIFKAS